MDLTKEEFSKMLRFQISEVLDKFIGERNTEKNIQSMSDNVTKVLNAWVNEGYLPKPKEKEICRIVLDETKRKATIIITDETMRKRIEEIVEEIKGE